MKRALLKSLLAAGSVGVLAAAMTSCAALHAAGNHAAEGGGAAAGGFIFYALALSTGFVGWAAAGFAGIGGWIGSWFFTPRSAPGAVSAGFPWGILILGAIIFALVRAWAHYPAIMKALWATVKAGARGLLGGIHPPK